MNSHPPPLGMQNGATTLENSLIEPCKMRRTLTLLPTIPSQVYIFIKEKWKYKTSTQQSVYVEFVRMAYTFKQRMLWDYSIAHVVFLITAEPWKQAECRQASADSVRAEERSARVQSRRTRKGVMLGEEAKFERRQTLWFCVFEALEKRDLQRHELVSGC